MSNSSRLLNADPGSAAACRRIRAAGAGLAAIALLAGCRGPAQVPGALPAAAAAVSPVAEAKREPPLAPLWRRFEKPGPAAAAAQAAPDAPPADPMLCDGWIRSPGPLRWHYPDLDDALAESPPARPDLHAALGSSNPVAAANAAIVLGRAGEASSMAALVDVVRNRQLRLSMRCAAAEALGCLPPAGQAFQPDQEVGPGGPTSALSELIDQYGQFGPDARARYQPELHAELLRSLARHVDPGADARFTAALRSPSPDVQIEAVRAWSSARGALPAEAADLRTARDARVRAAALTMLARRRHPRAGEWLGAALADWELPVRVAAIGGLGELADAPSREALRRAAGDRAELVRAAAVAALAEAGDREAVFQAAADKSWRVRQAVARALARYPDRTGAALARQLLADPSTAVPPAVLESLLGWPLEQCGPILLETMARDAFLVRQEAGAHLAERWAPAAVFSADAPPERRREMLDQLTREFRAQVGMADRAALAAAAAPPGAESGATAEERLARAERLVGALSGPAAEPGAAREAREGLLALGPDLLPALEALVRQRKRPLPEAVYRDVLTETGPEFAALDRLASRDAAVRRRAAAELAEAAARKRLGWLAADRLAALVAREADPLVWRSALEAVAEDGSEPGARVAAAGLGHSSAEVRRRACAHFAAHPDPANAALLLPALKDPSEPVVLAAVKALAGAARPEDAQALEPLLGHASETVRLHAAVALAQLGRASGRDALERLAHSGDPLVRREVAAAMGATGDRTFTGTLVRMLDDGHGIRRTALEALPKVAADGPPVPPGTSPSINEQVDAWKRWWERRPGAEQARLPQESPQ